MMENRSKPGEAYDQFIARARRGLEEGEASKMSAGEYACYSWIASDPDTKLKDELIKFAEKQPKLTPVALQEVALSYQSRCRVSEDTAPDRARNTHGRPAKGKQDLVCFRCGKKNHMARECKQNRDNLY